MNLNETPMLSWPHSRPLAKKAVLAVVVALATGVAVVAWWLLFEDPVVWAYFSLLILVGGYLLKEATRSRRSLAGLFLALAGLAVIIYGVEFGRVVALTAGGQQSAWLIPPGAGIRLGDGFTLEFHKDNYTYYVKPIAVLAGYLLFVTGLRLIDFQEA